AAQISSAAREPERFTKPPGEVERNEAGKRGGRLPRAAPARARGQHLSETVADSNTHLYLNAKMNPKGEWC
ncbi:hypothetical protein, partial [Burkholderia stabilis]